MNETAARELRRRIYVSQVGVTALGEMVRQAWEKNSLRAMMRQARLDDLEKRRAHAMVE